MERRSKKQKERGKATAGVPHKQLRTLTSSCSASQATEDPHKQLNYLTSSCSASQTTEDPHKQLQCLTSN